MDKSPISLIYIIRGDFMPFSPFGPNTYNQRQFNPLGGGLNRPINTPINRIPIKPPVRSATSKLTLSKFLSGTQQVIDTVNTAIPLYTQVKPFISGVGSVTKSLKDKLLNKAKKPETKNEYIANPEIITPKKSVKKSSMSNSDINEEKKPNRPFF